LIPTQHWSKTKEPLHVEDRTRKMVSFHYREAWFKS
jgi:hypothetical protein